LTSRFKLSIAAPGALRPSEDVEILTLVQYEDIASSHDFQPCSSVAARLHRFTSMYGIALAVPTRPSH
jgi:hypothetical protein